MVLIWPLFKTKYLENWTSIDATFIADARYLTENWPHPGWQPLWYGGTRFDYIYPPALRYGSAMLAKYAGLLPARGYHLYTAILYVIGIGGVWLFVWVATRARTRAWLAAAGVALLSPSLLVLDHIRNDINPYMPQRFNVLIRYGEGPHMSALAILPFVFAAAWWGLRRGHPTQLALSALAAALVVSNNFYGATALGIFFPLLTWAIFVTTRDWYVWMRAGAIALLAYGLTAFWLTPSYLAITSRNLAIVSQPGNLWSAGVAVLQAGAPDPCLLDLRLGRGGRDRPERAGAPLDEPGVPSGGRTGASGAGVGHVSGAGGRGNHSPGVAAGEAGGRVAGSGVFYPGLGLRNLSVAAHSPHVGGGWATGVSDHGLGE
jgi:hypothetical protein